MLQLFIESLSLTVLVKVSTMKLAKNVLHVFIPVKRALDQHYHVKLVLIHKIELQLMTVLV